VVTGVAYRTPDGQERTAAADLTVACDGMYSSLRAKLTVPQARQADPPASAPRGCGPARALHRARQAVLACPAAPLCGIMCLTTLA